MAKKTCFYCGTEYEAAEGKCPICGESRTTEDEAKKKENAPVFTPDVEEEQPRERDSGGIISTVICIILAIAVVIGTLFILRALGVFGTRQTAPEAQLPEAEQTETAAVPCTGLVVSPLNMSFTEAGQKTILTILPEPTDCTEQVELISSDPAVVTVTATGEVIAVGEGNATVTVTCGAFTKSANVVCAFLASGEPEPTETDQPVHVDASQLKLNREDFTLLKQGETFTMKLTGAPEGVEVQWSSDNPKVATIDKDGKVTGIGYGRTDIHATVGDAVVDCIVRCSFHAAATTAPVTTAPATTTPADDLEHTAVTTPANGTVQTSTIKLSHEDVTVKSDETFTIFLYSGSQRLSGVSWATTNASVATVTADGVVKGVGKGTATIVGTLEGNTYRCIVRCKG